MSTKQAQRYIIEGQHFASGSPEEGITPRVRGELAGILERSVFAEDEDGPAGGFWYCSIPAPGVRYYGFDEPERIGSGAGDG
jgi:hypothetical protein